MKSLIRRIEKLEQHLLPAPETAFSRRLLARLEAGRRRVALARGETIPTAVPPPETSPSPRLVDRVAILHRGRERARLQSRQKQVCSPPTAELVQPEAGGRLAGDSQ